MRTTVALILAVAAAGCTTSPSMKISSQLASVAPKPVSGRQAVLGRGTLTFDRWSSTAPARIPNDRWSHYSHTVAAGLGDEAGVEVDRAALQFSVNSGSGDAALTTQATCVARGRFAKRVGRNGRMTDETNVNVPGYPRIDCEFTGSEAGQLALRPSWLSQRDSGSAEFGDRRWTVESVNTTEHTNVPLTRFGYQFSVGSRVVAAVETFGSGRVWIDPSLKPREQEELAVATTALLYYTSLLEYEDS